MLSNMLANDVRTTLDHFRRSVDQMFDAAYGYPAERAWPAGEGTAQRAFSPMLESAWTNQTLNLRAVLPGVAEKDLKVSVQNNQLVVEGERRMPEGFDRSGYTQLMYGRFYNAVSLPAGVDADKITCRLHDGILDIAIPLAEGYKPRQIQIQSEGSRKAIHS
ncbi:MAG: Hsp20/alpha crystallin family protein [Bryobacteraceae bacterium]